MTNYEDYVFNAPYLKVPTPAINYSIDTDEEALAKISAYEEDVASFIETTKKNIALRTDTFDRFVKDACSGLSCGGDRLAVVDLVANTYVANKKADDAVRLASTGNSTSTLNGLKATHERLVEIFNSVLCLDPEGEAEPAGMVYDEMEDSVPYDAGAVVATVGEARVNFIRTVPMRMGTERTFAAYALEGGELSVAYTLKYESDNSWWVVSDKDGVPLLSCPDIDVDEPTWSKITTVTT